MNYRMSTFANLACAAGLFGFAACGGGQEQANAPASDNQTTATASAQPSASMADAGSFQSSTASSDTSFTTATASTAMGDAGSFGATNAMAAQSAADVSGFTDAQLAAVVKSINEGEIAAAQAATSQASSAEVKKFASHMIMQHRAMEAKDAAVLAKLQVTPTDNAVSDQLKTDAQNELSTLKGENGKDFDRDYIDGQVRDHAKALDLLDRVLSEAKNADFKADLKAARPKVESHLHDAERIQQTLQKGSAAASTGSTTTTSSGSNHGKASMGSTDSTSATPTGGGLSNPPNR